MDVSLRAWRMEDAPLAAEYCNNLEIARWLRDGFPHPYTLEDARDFIRAALETKADAGWLMAVCVDGALAGSVGAFRKQDVYRHTAELGYWLAQPYWGRGVMTRAVSNLCETLFRDTDLLRLEAEPYAPNAASRRLLEKCGFQLEGILRQNVFKNGDMMDSCVYGRLRGE